VSATVRPSSQPVSQGFATPQSPPLQLRGTQPQLPSVAVNGEAKLRSVSKPVALPPLASMPLVKQQQDVQAVPETPGHSPKGATPPLPQTTVAGATRLPGAQNPQPSTSLNTNAQVQQRLGTALNQAGPIQPIKAPMPPVSIAQPAQWQVPGVAFLDQGTKFPGAIAAPPTLQPSPAVRLPSAQTGSLPMDNLLQRYTPMALSPQPLTASSFAANSQSMQHLMPPATYPGGWQVPTVAAPAVLGPYQMGAQPSLSNLQLQYNMQLAQYQEQQREFANWAHQYQEYQRAQQAWQYAAYQARQQQHQHDGVPNGLAQVQQGVKKVGAFLQTTGGKSSIAASRGQSTSAVDKSQSVRLAEEATALQKREKQLEKEESAMVSQEKVLQKKALMLGTKEQQLEAMDAEEKKEQAQLRSHEAKLHTREVELAEKERNVGNLQRQLLQEQQKIWTILAKKRAAHASAEGMPARAVAPQADSGQHDASASARSLAIAPTSLRAAPATAKAGAAGLSKPIGLTQTVEVAQLRPIQVSGVHPFGTMTSNSVTVDPLTIGSPVKSGPFRRQKGTVFAQVGDRTSQRMSKRASQETKEGEGATSAEDSRVDQDDSHGSDLHVVMAANLPPSEAVASPQNLNQASGVSTSDEDSQYLASEDSKGEFADNDDLEQILLQRSSHVHHLDVSHKRSQ